MVFGSRGVFVGGLDDWERGTVRGTVGIGNFLWCPVAAAVFLSVIAQWFRLLVVCLGRGRSRSMVVGLRWCVSGRKGGIGRPLGIVRLR